MGADVIIGFPGETDADFESTVELVEEVRFSQAFLFRYSPRPGTPAWGRLADDVPDDVKRARLARLQKIQAAIQEERHQTLIGTRHEVLVEGQSRRNPRMLFGRNLAFDRIVFEGEPSWTDRFVDVEITDSTALTLSGKRVEVVPAACP